MLKNNDKVLAGLIEKEAHREETEIQLIASENYTSLDVMEANGSILTNKYSEGYPGKRYYGWCSVIDEIETLAIDRAKELFWAEHVNVQALSWSPANMAVYLWLLNPGDKVLGLSLDQWWHLSHGHPLNFSWILYEIIPYHLDKESGIIDMDEVEEIALREKPKMILAGFSAYPRNLDWKRFREITDKVWAILMADIAHIAGLIAGWVLENPVPYCDVVTTTTHKTLRWPRGWMIMCRQEYAKAIDRAIFPGIQWGPHENLIAWKAVAFKEALEPEFKIYARQIVDNAKVLAEELMNNGFSITSNGTDNHLILVDVFWSFDVTGKEAEKALEEVWLSTNKNMIPYDTRKALDPSGIRIGTPAATTRWMKENEMKIIAKVFKEAVVNKDDDNKLKELKKEILELCEKFPIYK